MHLRNYPQYYVKDGERREVFYTSDARDLVSMGWEPERQVKSKDKKEPKQEAEASKPEKIEVDVINEEIPEQDRAELPDFDFMTKSELLKYAMNRGVDLPSNMLKSDIVEACRKIK